MSPRIRRLFWLINRYFMTPVIRLGLSPLICNPLVGYIMLLKTVGRKSGKPRYTPVNYAIYRGSVYCLSGGKQSSDWYRNAMAAAEIEVILPGRAFFGRVSEECDPDVRRVVIRRVLNNAGFAGFLEGYNPRTISDDDLIRRTADLPLVCITPQGMGNGASDPGGWAWAWPIAATLVLLVVLLVR